MDIKTREQASRRHQEYLRSSEWAEVREAVTKRDKVCRHCGAAPDGERQFDVHHARGYANVLIWENDLADFDAEVAGCILLCRECHERVHRRGQLDDEQRKALREITGW